jgi:hypothetical protein
MLGRISASQRFLAFGMLPLGALLAGGLGTFVGVHTTIWIFQIALVLCCTPLITRPILANRNLPSACGATENAGGQSR